MLICRNNYLFNHISCFLFQEGMQNEKQSKLRKKRRRVQVVDFVEENIQAPENEEIEIGVPQIPVVNIKERSFDFDFQMPLENEDECFDNDQDVEENVAQEFAFEEISVLQESVVEALHDIVPDVMETQEDSTS
jgi:hypothetical protein